MNAEMNFIERKSLHNGMTVLTLLTELREYKENVFIISRD